MNKLLGITIVLGASSFGGFLLGERLAERCRMLKLWLRILELLRTEIYCHSLLLPEIFDRVASAIGRQSLTAGFQRLAQLIAYGSEVGVPEAWDVMVQENCSQVLSRDDCEILRSLGFYLGNTDREDQAQKIAATRLRLEANLADAELQAGKRIRLYRYLGFAAGAMVVLWLM
jgi:stage III sporulation protein AB